MIVCEVAPVDQAYVPVGPASRASAYSFTLTQKGNVNSHQTLAVGQDKFESYICTGYGIPDSGRTQGDQIVIKYYKLSFFVIFSNAL